MPPLLYLFFGASLGRAVLSCLLVNSRSHAALVSLSTPAYRHRLSLLCSDADHVVFARTFLYVALVSACSYICDSAICCNKLTHKLSVSSDAGCLPITFSYNITRLLFHSPPPPIWYNIWFLPRDAMLSAVYAVIVCLCVCLCVCVCVCVCVSVTLRYCIKTAKLRITQITPHDSPMTLVFWCQRSWRNSNGITPIGATNAGGVG